VEERGRRGKRRDGRWRSSATLLANRSVTYLLSCHFRLATARTIRRRLRTLRTYMYIDFSPPCPHIKINRQRNRIHNFPTALVLLITKSQIPSLCTQVSHSFPFYILHPTSLISDNMLHPLNKSLTLMPRAPLQLRRSVFSMSKASVASWSSLSACGNSAGEFKEKDATGWNGLLKCGVPAIALNAGEA